MIIKKITADSLTGKCFSNEWYHLGNRLIEDPFIARNEVPTNFNNGAETEVESFNLQPNKRWDYFNEYDHPFKFNCEEGNLYFDDK